MANEQPRQVAATDMTREEIEELFARRVEAYEDLDAAALAEHYADDVHIESPITGVHGKAAAERNLRVVFDAFMDLKMKFDPPIIDGNRVALMSVAEGTNMGGLLGLPPSGRPFRIQTAFFYEVKGGKIVREQRVYDFTGMLVQCGILKAKPV